MRGESLPVYGDGGNIRDWLYVEDHCVALQHVLAGGVPGETYNIGGNCEMANLDVVKAVCELLDNVPASAPHSPHDQLIRFVSDRPGHDRRYAINASKMRSELHWQPRENIASGLRKTVDWYLANMEWVEQVASGEYRNWVEKNYSSRAGNQ
jgi:dTDP-glucose 4,6-dehydratase